MRGGDTLSAIGKQFGVDYKQITGYKSGNPNLIYPGEVLNIPDKPGSVPAPMPQAQPQQQYTQQPQAQSYTQPQPTQQTSNGGDFGSWLRSHGYNDENVIRNAVANPATAGSAYQDFLRESGVSSPSPQAAATPQFNATRPVIPDFQKIYDTTILEGTKDYQTQFDTLTTKMQQREQARNEAVAKIADNPYLSEATMTGRIAKLNAIYNADTQTLIKQQGIIQDKITTAKADAQVKLNIATQQYNIQNQQYQQNLQLYSNLLTSGGFINASSQDIADAAVTMGVPVSMIQSIINKQKKDQEVKPSLQTVDDGTNQYVVAIDQDGNVINKSIIGSSKPKVAAGTSQNDKQEKAFDSAIAEGIKQLKSGEDWGTVWNRIKSKFPDVPDILIDSGLGTFWREYGAYQTYQAKINPPKSSNLKLGGT